MKKFDVEKTLAYLRGLNPRSLSLRLADVAHRAPTIQLLRRVDIYDKTGKLVRTTGDRKSHSFVIQFLKLMEVLMAHPWEGSPDSVSITDTGGSNRNFAFNLGQYVTRLLSCEAGAGDVNYGIVVGTGTDAPASDDYDLQTKIAHGNSTGQLQYGATSVAQAAVVGDNVDMVISRIFVNASGGSITLREAGLIVRHALIGTTGYYFLVIRDAVNQEVADTYVAVVTYTLRTTV